MLALAKYLAILNFVLGVFNLVPGFPLDGGRIFRSILWGITGNFRRSSAIATVTVRALGFALIFAGAWLVLTGNVFNGLWLAFIGWFLESAAAGQDQLQVVKELLGGHKVSEVMSRDFPRILRNVTLQELVDKDVPTWDAILRRGQRPGLGWTDYPLDYQRSTAGFVAANDGVAGHDSAGRNRIDSASGPIWNALEKMGRDGVNQLPVLNGGGGDRVVGMLSRDDLVHYLRVLQSLAK